MKLCSRRGFLKGSIITTVCVLILVSVAVVLFSQEKKEPTPRANKLRWFIPDGMRCDPEVFNVFRWAEEGKLPNIKKLMEKGSYGYCIPTFPSHTPVNFATLLTGTYPEVHGIADGPMHVEGQPLRVPSVGGFSSSARKVPAIWSILEDPKKKIVLLSIPGSTPPELRYNGITIRGRWGGWGADMHSLIFETTSESQKKKLAKGSKLFFLGHELTRFTDASSEHIEWREKVSSYSLVIDLELEVYGTVIYAKIVDTTDDEETNYDSIVTSSDKKEIEASLAQGEWSEWLPVDLEWSGQSFGSHIKINVIKLGNDGFFRVRILVDNLNNFIVDPAEVSEELLAAAGPMVDFVDNYPPQLIYYDEDKQTFLDEAKMSFEWHKRAIKAIEDKYEPDIFIHDIYTPNQMLTSRWWLGYIDPDSARYDEVSALEREELWTEVLAMYKQLDDIVGILMENADEDTLIVLSSDHGAAPLNKHIRLNNLFAEKGWLKFQIEPLTKEPVIDWENTQVVFLKMNNVYIKPEGLGGNWKRGSGEEYEKLRDEVLEALKELESPDGNKPLSKAVKWEDASEFLDLPKDRVGDIVIANTPGYGWTEEITEDLIVTVVPLKTGYKQAILPKETPSMWTPFIISGPGVKQGYRIDLPISMADQFPTIMTLLGEEVPSYVQGETLEEIIEK